MENIRYGRPDATDKEVINGAIKEEIHDEIMSMPDGYQTFVGERGDPVRRAKQRISIARVIRQLLYRTFSPDMSYFARIAMFFRYIPPHLTLRASAGMTVRIIFNWW